eukprot:scaffold82483_cov19-Prasinocladus_malaysianus.AAC.1
MASKVGPPVNGHEMQPNASKYVGLSPIPYIPPHQMANTMLGAWPCAVHRAYLVVKANPAPNPTLLIDE